MDNLTSSIKGKVAFISGASSGLGRQFALALARNGATVIIAARRIEKLEELAAQINQSGGTAFAVKLDVTDGKSINAAVNLAMEKFGRVDILINNAGNIVRRDTLDFTEEDFDSIVNTHVRGYWLNSMSVIREMLKKKLPCNIINISSMAGSKSYANGTVYSTAKAAVSHLTRSLALEFAKYKIRVNAIAPGVFITDLNRAALETGLKTVIERIPIGRPGNFEEIEAPMLFLASDASSYMTGAILAVDGGYASNPM